jgi:hypothetical protein
LTGCANAFTVASSLICPFFNPETPVSDDHRTRLAVLSAEVRATLARLRDVDQAMMQMTATLTALRVQQRDAIDALAIALMAEERAAGRDAGPLRFPPRPPAGPRLVRDATDALGHDAPIERMPMLRPVDGGDAA